MHSIEKLTSKHRIVIQFGSYVDHDPDAFAIELKQAAFDVKGSLGEFDILADFTESMVMPQDAAKSSEDVISWCLANGMRKSANVIQNVTQRMQVKRVTEQDPRFGYFGTREQAAEWLDQ